MLSFLVSRANHAMIPPGPNGKGNNRTHVPLKMERDAAIDSVRQCELPFLSAKCRYSIGRKFARKEEFSAKTLLCN